MQITTLMFEMLVVHLLICTLTVNVCHVEGRLQSWVGGGISIEGRSGGREGFKLE
jgi:hypothetical protein